MQYDAIVIGTGQAGPSLAARLAGSGWKVAIVERGRFGGTCVNTGCIPTKALVASARAAWMARHADDYGVLVEGAVSVDMMKVKARKDKVAGASRTGVETWLRSTNNCTVYDGHARFRSDHEVAVGNESLTAERIFINVGARAAIPPIPGLAAVPFLTNSSVMNVDSLPSHLIIVGGSYIGLEFAQMYRRFGSRVTVIERGRHCWAVRMRRYQTGYYKSSAVKTSRFVSILTAFRPAMRVTRSSLEQRAAAGIWKYVVRTCCWPSADNRTRTTSDWRTRESLSTSAATFK